MIDELAADLRRSRAVHLLLPLFFLSGATALAYQTLWVRELQIELFGTSTFAVSTVLAAFMGGLAIGGFAMAGVADRITRPLAVYGGLEIGIGLYAMGFPVLVDLIQPVYLEAWRTWQPGPVAFGLIQFALVSVCLVLPTAAMGATLPLLARFATERLGAAGGRVGTLYAVNTLGAVVGTALCGFVLLPAWGRGATTVLAASANVALGLSALALSGWIGGHEARVIDDRPPESVDGWRAPVTVAIGLAGVAALTYEVAWTRLLGLMLGASTYAFSAMLLSFLVGIALGGALGGPLADRVAARRGVGGVVVVFALVEVAIACVSYAMMYLYPQLPFAYVSLFDALRAEALPGRVSQVSLIVAGLVMTPPAILMGVHFPLAVRAVVRGEQLGKPVGVIYGVNTLGGVFGAFVAGFVLLPTLNLNGTVYIAGLVELFAAGVLLVAAVRNPATRAVAMPILAGGGVAAGLLGALAQRPPWDPLLMTAGMPMYVAHFDDHSREGIERFATNHQELVYYAEGLSTVITVARNTTNDNLWLANNGKVEASSQGDLSTQLLCTLLPAQYVDSPDEVLVIGLASGITAGATTLLDGAQTIEIVELEPRMEEAARLFGPFNHHVLDDARVRLVFNDGRNHVLLAERGRYDLVVSEPSNPWLTGVANLFTKDFLEVGRTRLTSGGVWAQWLQMYHMSPDDLRTLLATVASVFPHVNVYAIEYDDLVLVASEHPLPRTFAHAEHVFSQPKARAELAKIDIHGPADLLALFQFDETVIRRIGDGVPLNTDDNMAIEYSAPQHLHRPTSDLNEALFKAHAQVPLSFVASPEDLVALAKAYRARGDDRAIKAMEAAIEAAPNEETAIAWAVMAESWEFVPVETTR